MQVKRTQKGLINWERLDLRRPWWVTTGSPVNLVQVTSLSTLTIVNPHLSSSTNITALVGDFVTLTGSPA